jgi:hypothetical protein
MTSKADILICIEEKFSCLSSLFNTTEMDFTLRLTSDEMNDRYTA